MNIILGGTQKATLHVSNSDGTSYSVAFEVVQRLDFDYAGPLAPAPCSQIKLMIQGLGVTTVHTASKETDKPASKKTKKPSVKASAARVYNATLKQFQVAKRIASATRTLTTLRHDMEYLDVEVKTAREQLFASATPETR